MPYNKWMTKPNSGTTLPQNAASGQWNNTVDTHILDGSQGFVLSNKDLS